MPTCVLSLLAAGNDVDRRADRCLPAKRASRRSSSRRARPASKAFRFGNARGRAVCARSATHRSSSTAICRGVRRGRTTGESTRARCARGTCSTPAPTSRRSRSSNRPPSRCSAGRAAARRSSRRSCRTRTRRHHRRLLRSRALRRSRWPSSTTATVSSPTVIGPAARRTPAPRSAIAPPFRCSSRSARTTRPCQRLPAKHSPKVRASRVPPIELVVYPGVGHRFDAGVVETPAATVRASIQRITNFMTARLQR
jgi:hypothetical protein